LVLRPASSAVFPLLSRSLKLEELKLKAVLAMLVPVLLPVLAVLALMLAMLAIVLLPLIVPAAMILA
jgi:uncharacterized membrane protein